MSSDFLRLVRKETRELLRPRYIVPILLVPVMFLALGQGVGSLGEELEENATVGVVTNDTGQYAETVVETYNRTTNVTYFDRNVGPETAIDQTREGGGRTVVVIPSNFTDRIADGQRGRVQAYSIVDSVGLSAVAGAGKGLGPLSAAGNAITIQVTGATPTQLSPVETTQTTFLKGTRMDAPPSALTESFSSQFLFIPLVIVMVIIFAGQMVMNSMGTEKENKTLETLLTMPVKRRTIVAAKLTGSAIVGLLAAGVLSGSLFYYQSSLSIGSDSGGGLPEVFSLGPVDYVLIGVAIFLAVITALAMALCLGIFAGDQQGAQILVFPLALLAGAPAALTVFTDLTTMALPIRAVMYAIPFTYPTLAPKQLLFGDPTIIYLGIAYEAVFTVAMVGLAVRLFDSDRVVTGDAGRLGDVLSSLQR